MNIPGAVVFWSFVTLSSACSAPTGIAYLHVTELPGSCASYTQPVPNVTPTQLDLTPFDNQPFRRVHATAAFEGGSAWAGGNVIAVAWQDPDGSVWRLMIDVSPQRGYGASIAESPQWQQGAGLVVWKDGHRQFGGQQVFGRMNYEQDVQGRPTEMFARLAFDGTGPQGEPLCRVLGVHAAITRERTDPYDPSWLRPDPSLLVRTDLPASFMGDSAPTAHVVAPGAAGPDPGGPAPMLQQHAFIPSDTSAGNASYGCD